MRKIIFTLALLTSCILSSAQDLEVQKKDSLPKKTFFDRLSFGAYGEIGFSRNFYSDHVSRYSQPEAHKDDPSHGRFDIPHVAISNMAVTVLPTRRKTKKAANGNRKPRKAVKWNWNSSGFRSLSTNGLTSVLVTS